MSASKERACSRTDITHGLVRYSSSIVGTRLALLSWAPASAAAISSSSIPVTNLLVISHTS